MHRLLLVTLGSLLLGCGDDGGGSTTPDAAPAIDAPASSLVEVSPCPASPDATVITTDSVDRYDPVMTTISQGQVVRFQTSLNHNIVPLPPTDPALTVGYNKTACFRFTAPGTFRFYCMPHGFAGTITVN